MVKKRVIKFFAFFFLFAISLILMHAIFLGKVSILKASPIESDNFEDQIIPKAERSLITSFAISESGGADFSMFTAIILSAIMLVVAIKFLYNHNKRIRSDVLSNHIDRGLIRLDLP